MKRDASLIGIVLAAALVLGTGCLGDAPRDNPLDPDSERFVDAGDLEGRVTDRADAPLDGVEVRLIPGPSAPLAERVLRTDGQGRFVFSDVPGGGGYRIQASRDGYAVAVLDGVRVEAGPPQQVPALRLNALPSFAGTALRTVHVSRWWPQNDLFFLEVDADVNDADGLFDIDRVWFEIPDLGFSVGLNLQAAGRFDTVIQADSLPTGSLHNLLGRALRLNVRDLEGVVVSSTPQQIVRILEATPTPAAPRDDVLLATGLPALSWDPFPAAFSFTYRIDIYRAEVNRDVRVLQSDPLPRDVTSLQLATPLATGPYFWTVTVVDAFGNQSRSKEAAFRIP